MAVKTNFYLNESLVNPPRNWQELQIEINFDKDKSLNEQVSLNDWEFVRENSEFIQTWIDDGLTTGVGVFEGIPFRIELDRNGDIEKPFDGYIDLTDSAILSCNRSTVKAKERQQIDWLNDVADSFTFEYLYRETGEITKDDFKFMPYVINSIPDYQQSAVALLSVYVISQEIQNAIQKVKELSPEIANPLTAAAGILKAVLLVAYITLLLVSLLKLIKDMIYFLIQPVKYHAGMYVKTLLQKGAAHLGLTFKSEIFEQSPYDKLFILPEKLYNPLETTEKKILGFLQPNKNSQEGFYKGTFGDLLRAMKQMFYAKIVMQGSDLILIRRDKNTSQPQYTAPDVYQPFYGLNTTEFVSNYYLKFQYDLLDKNTIQEYEGTAFQVFLQPKVINNKDLVLTKNLEEVNIPFALAKIKTSLTFPEQIFKAFLDIFSLIINGIISAVNVIIAVANAVVKALNAIIKALKLVGIKVNWKIATIPKLKFVSGGSVIDNRIGMLKIETDAFNTAKVFLLTEGSAVKFNKIGVTNAVDVNAKALYNNYHYVNSFLPTNDRPNANQYVIRELAKVPFCYEDFVKVKQNNIIFTKTGEAEIQSLKWDVYNQHADMVIRVNQLYTNNLIKIEMYHDGR